MKRILLIEDEVNLSASLSDFLSYEGFKVQCARTLDEGRKLATQGMDVVILDWMLPDGQGLQLLREWRGAGSTVPVLLLTARTELVDKILGLEMGANDYLTKPFEPRELLARINVQLRAGIAGRLPRTGIEASRAGIRLDIVTRRVTFAGAAVELKRMEFSLLKLFLENPEQVFSRDELLNKVWGYDCYPTTRTVDTHILQLRQKFHPDLIETVRGIGYRFHDVKPGLSLEVSLAE